MEKQEKDVMTIPAFQEKMRKMGFLFLLLSVSHPCPGIAAFMAFERAHV